MEVTTCALHRRGRQPQEMVGCVLCHLTLLPFGSAHCLGPLLAGGPPPPKGVSLPLRPAAPGSPPRQPRRDRTGPAGKRGQVTDRGSHWVSLTPPRERLDPSDRQAWFWSVSFKEKNPDFNSVVPGNKVRCPLAPCPKKTAHCSLTLLYNHMTNT